MSNPSTPEKFVARINIPESDWDQVKFLYFAGLTVGQIAEKTGIDRFAIYKKIQRRGWKIELEQLLNRNTNENVSNSNTKHLNKQQMNKNSNFIQSQSCPTVERVQPIKPPTSINSTQILSSVMAERKQKYLDVVSRATERASQALDNERIENLTQASTAFRLFEPVHNVAKSVLGLDAKADNAIQVNIVSGNTDVEDA